MLQPLTEHRLAYHQCVLALECQCALQQALTWREAATHEEDRTVRRWMDAQVRYLQARIRLLEVRLQRNASDSALPSSIAGPGVDRPMRRDERKRRQGGPKGHSIGSRQRVPIEDVGAVAPCKPGPCCDRDDPLSSDDTNPLRHRGCGALQRRIVTTAFQHPLNVTYRLTCPYCGEAATGELQVCIHHGSVGPRLHMLTAMLTGSFLPNRRRAGTRHVDVSSLEANARSTIAKERRIAEAPADPAQRVQEWVRSALVRNGWLAKPRTGCGTAAADAAVVIKYRRLESQEAATALLGEDLTKAVRSDRFDTRSWIDRLGHCWAHPKREAALRGSEPP